VFYEQVFFIPKKLWMWFIGQTVLCATFSPFETRKPPRRFQDFFDRNFHGFDVVEVCVLFYEIRAVDRYVAWSSSASNITSKAGKADIQF